MIYDLLASDKKNDCANDEFEGDRVSRVDSEKYGVCFLKIPKQNHQAIFSSYSFLKKKYYIIVNNPYFYLIFIKNKNKNASKQ